MPRKGTEAAAARRFEGLARLAREELPGEVSESAHVAGRARFVAAVQGERPSVAPARGNAAVWRAAYAIAAVVVLALGAWGWQRWRAPEWQVEGAVATTAASDGAFVQSPAQTEATIHYSDGSDVVLAPATRARVSKGHRVVLEDGKAHVRIAHGARLAFLLDAGPYTVGASRGELAITWSGADQRLEVSPKDGAATVRGALAGAGLDVQGGDRLTASVRTGELRVTRADGAVTTSIAPSAAPAPTPSDAPSVLELPATDAPSATAMNAPPASAPRVAWPALVARGEYASVVREADAAGIDSVLARRPLADLAALADASRYASRADVAKRALLAERSRFPGTTEAKTAAFLLGRLADDQEHAPAKAIPWYDRYLKEAPSGAFASDALGRKMVAVQRTKGPDAARSIAETYARRFPHGAYANVAEELLGQ